MQGIHIQLVLVQSCIHYGIYMYNVYACMQAFKVMKECCSYEKRRVRSGIILFNVEAIHVGFRRRKAICCASMDGTEYTFLDGAEVLFSSRQCDTQCSLWECAGVIRYPQQVRTFLTEGESREFPQLKNLSELTLTGREDKKYLLMRKMKEDGSMKEQLYTVPADGTTKVTMNTTDDTSTSSRIGYRKFNTYSSAICLDSCYFMTVGIYMKHTHSLCWGGGSLYVCVHYIQ